MLTEEQSKKYIFTKTPSCPYCYQRAFLVKDLLMTEWPTVYRTIQCALCEKQWREEFLLVQIKELEAEEADVN